MVFTVSVVAVVVDASVLSQGVSHEHGSFILAQVFDEFMHALVGEEVMYLLGFHALQHLAL